MNYSMHLLLTLTTLLPVKPRETADTGTPAPKTPELSDVVEAARQRLLQLVDDFRSQPVAPLRAQQFEQQLQEALRELGRGVTQWTYNHLEPAAVTKLAEHVHYEAGQYTRLN